MDHALAVKRVDIANVFLVLVALAVAVYYPYRGFLVAYAVLGPLHYLTELNWLHNRDYFIKDRRWVWIALGAALALGLPKLAMPASPVAQYLPDALTDALIAFNRYTDAFLLIGLIMALTFVFTQNRYLRWGMLALAIVGGILLNQKEYYVLVIGFLLPTLIHVYLFTLLFMYFGARKSGSRWGFVALAMTLAVPIFVALFDPQQMLYLFPEETQAAIAENQFHVTNAFLGKVLGLTSGENFEWYGRLFLRLQIFITFAYVYHYLNWFSKTSIIGWHKNLNLRRTIGLVAIWLGVVALFAYDYKVGVLVGLSLSFMHVLGEFPLNVVTIRNLFGGK